MNEGHILELRKSDEPGCTILVVRMVLPLKKIAKIFLELAQLEQEYNQRILDSRIAKTEKK